MKTNEFFFDLPEELIAQQPTDDRSAARMLVLPRGTGLVEHRRVRDLPEALPARTLIVVNDSRVVPCRLFGTDSKGRRVEVLLTERRDQRIWTCLVGGLRKGETRLVFPDDIQARVGAAGEGVGKEIEFSRPIGTDYLEAKGHMPLPPYIRRDDVPADRERYQTVYARQPGSQAAPTAGLHFDETLLKDLRARGHEIVPLTLHVGLGTFIPIREDDIEDHRMHAEWYSISEKTATAVNNAKNEGRPVLAVGTTSLRSLEAAASAGPIQAGDGRTDIYIRPGHRFRVVDLLFTNFHTPKSTLLVLVAAFAGRERILAAYEEAVRQRYRFLSYGDAMLITQAQ